MDFKLLKDQMKENNESYINCDENNWTSKYVIFADLIGFKNRCQRSNDATVNNIHRYRRAISKALDGLAIKKFLFTDACYVLTSEPKVALLAASNIQNECLLHNIIQLEHVDNPLFHHMIIPKIVISKGDVLCSEKDPNLLAGSGIVNAYNLEKYTTGGLISCDQCCINDLKKPEPVNEKTELFSLYRSWKHNKIEPQKNSFFFHDDVFDIPWIALQSRLSVKGEVKLESIESLRIKIKSFKKIWEMSFSEHIVERTPTQTLKHFAGAMSHLCDFVQLYKKTGKIRWDMNKLSNEIDSI